MNFIQAIKVMRQGQRIRLPFWHHSVSLGLHNPNKPGEELARYHNGKYSSVTILDFSDVEDISWQLYGKKNLYDMGYVNLDRVGREYREQDIKDHLKEFLDCLMQGKNEYSPVRKKAREIFGEKFID